MLRRSLGRHVKLRRLSEAPRLLYKRFHSSPPRQVFGLKLPTPSNEPLAGTVAGDGIPFLLILEVVLALPITLWLYKCLMLVAFQRKIIYLPSVPPGTRNESLAEEERTKERDSSLSGMDWKEVTIESSAPSRILRQKVKLKGIEVKWKNDKIEKERKKSKVVVIYLQGNAGTPLLRIPLFRQLLRDHNRTSFSSRSTLGAPSRLQDLTILAVAPRSFWTSTPSTPTESSVLADYRSALEFAYDRHGPSAKYVLYGHSLGGAATILLLDQLSVTPFTSAQPQIETTTSTLVPSPAGLILENPLPSIPYMVKALYPQKWLPYHYLGFTAFDKWDAIGRLRNLASTVEIKGGRTRQAIPSLWIRSGRDEIIPTGQEDGVKEMFENWRKASEGRDQAGDDSKARWIEVESALHDTAYLERKWSKEIGTFLEEIASQEFRRFRS
ncbi:hypothetical protein JCM5350_004215 [Sporobolomyces pararoseus]